LAVSDGDQKQLRSLAKTATELSVKLIIILDLIHLLEYLWHSAWALFEPTDTKAEEWVSKHLLEILSARSSIVAAALRRSATLRQLSDKQRAPIDKCADYLLKNRDYLHYDQYLAAGYPIASGVIEGACHHIVKDRMEISGARWRLNGALSNPALPGACAQVATLTAIGSFTLSKRRSAIIQLITQMGKSRC